MIGKIMIAVIALVALATAASVYYLQVYYYYDEITLDPAQVTLVPLGGGAPVPIPASGVLAIDANSSPIRFRACFDTDLTPAAAAEIYRPAPNALPLNAPSWFDCFDADAIGAALEAGHAATFMASENVAYGADRIIALTRDGRGYIWQQLNNCGEKAYDGTQVGDDCPPREDFE